jgi:hypothetical protein
MKTIHAMILVVFSLACVGCGDPNDTKQKSSATIDGKPSGSTDVDATQNSARASQNADQIAQTKNTNTANDNSDTRNADAKGSTLAVKPTDDSATGNLTPRQANQDDKNANPNADDDEKGLVEIGSADPNDEPLKPIDEGPPPTQLPKDFLGDGVRPLNKQGTVLIDVPRKKIFLKTHVSLRTGALEMLVCLKQTKEHESIVALDSQAYTIHTALVALGMSEGKASYWLPPKNDDDDPEFFPAQGEKIDIFVHWRDTAGKLHREPAQHWIRHTINRYYDEQFEKLPADLKLIEDENLRWDEINKTMFWYGPMSKEQHKELMARSTDKKYQAAITRFHKNSQPREMAADFLFVGSGFFEDEGERQYLAEGGYVVCVANFNMAMIDISAESNSQGEALTYEAYTERIPPRKSEVLIELMPAKKVKTTEKK